MIRQLVIAASAVAALATAGPAAARAGRGVTISDVTIRPTPHRAEDEVAIRLDARAWITCPPRPVAERSAGDAEKARSGSAGAKVIARPPCPYLQGVITARSDW